MRWTRESEFEQRLIRYIDAETLRLSDIQKALRLVGCSYFPLPYIGPFITQMRIYAGCANALGLASFCFVPLQKTREQPLCVMLSDASVMQFLQTLCQNIHAKKVLDVGE